MMIDNQVMNREFKAQSSINPYAAAMNMAYGLPKYDEKDFQLPPALLSMHNGAAAAYYSSRMPMTTASYAKPAWRKGKWLDEEESYTKKLIEAFNNGYLNIGSGTTLRSFLSERLSCDPMRITKKFAGSSCIGKQVYTPCDMKTVDPVVVAEAQEELKELEDKFRAKVDGQRALEYYPVGAPPSFAPIHPAAFHAPRLAYMEGLAAEYYAAMPGQGPLTHMMPNPYLMKMYGNQDMPPLPFIFPHHVPSPQYSQNYNSDYSNNNNIDMRSEHSNIPVVALKPKASRTSEEASLSSSSRNHNNNNNKNEGSNKRMKTEKKAKKENSLKGNGVQGDLDASDLLLNFFKAANESLSKSRSNSEELETAKFDDKKSNNDSASSVASSTLTSASNLVGLISATTSEEEDNTEESQSLLTKRSNDDDEDYDQYDILNPTKRVRSSEE